MSDVEWDADDFEPPNIQPTRLTDKWEGEDEEEVVKDNWDDDDEEDDEGSVDDKNKKPKPDTNGEAAKKKKKRKLADIIAEKELKQQEERERRKKEQEEREKSLTPEEKLAEKLRMQKIQEDADLQLANDLVGEGGPGSTVEEGEVLLDGLDISTSAGLESFRKAIVSKVRSTSRLEKRPFYVTFVEDLARELCANVEMDEVKRVTAVLNSLYNEKVKASKPKTKKKGGQKAKLNVGQGALADDIATDYGYNDYDDFI